jgi:metallophosphoesterase superfamily enzyme
VKNIDPFEDGSSNPLDCRVKLIKKGNKKTLIVADLHLGIELEFLRHGVSIQGISQETITDLCDIANAYDFTNIIFLGDTKHSIGVTKFEKKLLERLVNKIAQVSDIKLVFGIGNHDSNITKLLPSKDFPIFSGRGIILKTDEGKIGLAHGHQIPDFQQVDEIILGHVHPSVLLREFPSESKNISPQSLYRFPVILTGTISLPELRLAYNLNKPSISQSSNQSERIRIRVLPGFNKILSSSRISNRFSIHPSKRLKHTFIDRLFTLIDFEVTLINGSYLGLLSELNQRINSE